MDNKLLAILLIGGIVLLSLLLALPERAAPEAKVTLSEWSLMPAILSLPPGSFKFVVTNSGKLEHAFEIESQADHKELGDLEHIAPGQTKALTVTLTAGTYELYCPIPGHKEKGLMGTLIVGPGAAQIPNPNPVTPGATQTPSKKP